MTGMGHFGAHYTGEPWLVQHIVGGVKWAAGMVEGDCGATVWRGSSACRWTRTPAPRTPSTSPRTAGCSTPSWSAARSGSTTRAPRAHPPRSPSRSTPAVRTACSGIALDPNFADNGYLYIYYSPASDDDTNPDNFVNRLSRLTVGEGRRSTGPARRCCWRSPHGACPTSRATPAVGWTSGRRQPLPRCRRRREPALRTVRRLRATLRTRTYVPRRAGHLGQHQRPSRQDPAHPPGAGRHLLHPRGQPVPAGHREDPARRSTRWASATRSGSPSTRSPVRWPSPTTHRTTAATTPTAGRPVSPSGT